MIPQPDLRIVPLADIIEHEYNDLQRTLPLIERLKAEGVLKNPPIVAPLAEGDRRFVVLDGANRSTALHHMGYPHILAQVVAYRPPLVTLSTWHHVLTDLDMPAFQANLHALTGAQLTATDLLTARANLARREALAYLLYADGQVVTVQSASRALHAQNATLNALVNCYKSVGALHRTATDDLAENKALHPNLAVLVVFPNYNMAEVLALARDGELLPPGLTRHLIQGRALRINYPLSELAAPDSLEAKNARLQAWVREKAAQRAMRLYAEATFMFDE